VKHANGSGTDVDGRGTDDPTTAAIRATEAVARADRESSMRSAVDAEPIWTRQAGETAWDRYFRFNYENVGRIPETEGAMFNAFVAAEVAAAKPKHAETAEQVAAKAIAEYEDHTGGKPYAHLTLKGIITAAIKRERGEA